MNTPVHSFHRWINPTQRGATENRQTLEATPAERASLAAWLDIPSIEAMSAEVEIRRLSSDVAGAKGRLRASVELICGVTLEPFVQAIDTSFEARFRKPAGHAPKHESADPTDIEVTLADDEPGDWLQQGIDIGAFVAEELSLALPDFPRKPNAAFESDSADDLADEKPNPFAALIKLKESGS
jgi:uncharacterized metal-binding protein YceD (DUF177 family)